MRYFNMILTLAIQTKKTMWENPKFTSEDAPHPAHIYVACEVLNLDKISEKSVIDFNKHYHKEASVKRVDISGIREVDKQEYDENYGLHMALDSNSPQENTYESHQTFS